MVVKEEQLKPSYCIVYVDRELANKCFSIIQATSYIMLICGEEAFLIIVLHRQETFSGIP
jgi:hypothetical protein